MTSNTEYRLILDMMYSSVDLMPVERFDNEHSLMPGEIQCHNSYFHMDSGENLSDFCKVLANYLEGMLQPPLICIGEEGECEFWHYKYERGGPELELPPKIKEHINTLIQGLQKI